MWMEWKCEKKVEREEQCDATLHTVDSREIPLLLHYRLRFYLVAFRKKKKHKNSLRALHTHICSFHMNFMLYQHVRFSSEVHNRRRETSIDRVDACFDIYFFSVRRRKKKTKHETETSSSRCACMCWSSSTPLHTGFARFLRGVIIVISFREAFCPTPGCVFS